MFKYIIITLKGACIDIKAILHMHRNLGAQGHVPPSPFFGQEGTHEIASQKTRPKKSCLPTSSCIKRKRIRQALITAASCKKNCVQNILTWLSGRAVRTQLQIVLISSDGCISNPKKKRKFFSHMTNLVQYIYPHREE